MPIEVDFGPVTGKIQSRILDQQGIAPVRVIRRDDGWTLSVDWELDGLLVSMLSGTWHIQAYLESFGPQQETMFLNEDVDFSDGITADPRQLKYHRDFPISGKVPEENGVYRVMTVITCTTHKNKPGPFAGFDQGPLIQFYPHP